MFVKKFIVDLKTHLSFLPPYVLWRTSVITGLNGRSSKAFSQPDVITVLQRQFFLLSWSLLLRPLLTPYTHARVASSVYRHSREQSEVDAEIVEGVLSGVDRKQTGK